MAERRATNKYYPPNWDPSKGSINRFRGSHPLRSRARKQGEGITIIRFEMPFDIWCSQCNAIIVQGTRFNAEKKENGTYFSTKIMNFAMKCEYCKNRLVIETDPQNNDYAIREGGRRKIEEFEHTKEDHTVIFLSEEERQKLQQDNLYRLEHDKETEQFARQVMDPVIASLQVLQQDAWKNDYQASKILRKRLREEKKQEESDLNGMNSKFGAIFSQDEDDGKLKLLNKLEQDVEQAKQHLLETSSGEAQRKSDLIRSTSIFSTSVPKKAVQAKEILKRNVLQNRKKDSLPQQQPVLVKTEQFHLSEKKRTRQQDDHTAPVTKKQKVAHTALSMLCDYK